jgi:SAM-dependent methyltransferase
MQTESPPSVLVHDFTTVTELPGSNATSEQVARLYHRYHTAAHYATNKRVLEVACGAGLGLGYLGRVARSIVGGDYTAHLLQVAQAHYRGRIPLCRFDAQHLPFRSKSYDLIVIFEAIYYLPQAEYFLTESRRLLSDDGILLLSTVNKDWSEFIPSPFSVRYFSVPELRDLLLQGGFNRLEFFGAFPTAATTTKEKIVSLVRRAATSLNLVPKTLAGRERFKRLFYGCLQPLKPEIEDSTAPLSPLVPIDETVPTTQYKIIYAVGHLANSTNIEPF